MINAATNKSKSAPAEQGRQEIVRGYTMRSELGTGSFGNVYLMHQPMLDREVAVKVISPQYANRPDFIRRFEVEAQLVARLEHPFIVPLYDFWREPTGAYLVMRYLRGGSVRDYLHKARHAGEPTPWTLEEIAEMLNQITSALGAAHRQGIIHRDLKPGNIILDDDGNAYLADFGIAKDTSKEAGDKGGFMGSPAYASPEQINGQQVAAQSDIYSLGIMLYEILTTQHPFPYKSISSLFEKQLQEPVPSVREIRADYPPAVDNVLQRATDKDPEERYESANALAAAFRQAINPQTVIQPPRGFRMHSTQGAASLDDIDMAAATQMLVTTNPYKGLRAFQEADASDFFGRSKLIAKLKERMQEDHPFTRFLAVVGPSGSGKSSVVKAGLVPDLRHGGIENSSDWFISEMIPSISPFEELKAALLSVAVNAPDQEIFDRIGSDDPDHENSLGDAVKSILPDDGSEFLLVIDQFEEVFTQTDSEATRSLFLRTLYNAVVDPESRLRVIVTLRADFYDRPLLRPLIGDLMRERTEVVLPLSRDELEEAIRGPAERVGMILESGLTSAIANDVLNEPGALPLLQYALTELFEHRQGRVLMLSAYQDNGGAKGALARRAEQLHEEASDEEREAIRQLFLRLVTLGEGQEDTRRRVLRSELVSLGARPEVLRRAMDEFGKHRLLTFDVDPTDREPTVEVAHEALIRTWKRLREWLDKGREEVRLQRRLTNAAEEWHNSGQDPSFLASGSRLVQLEEWLRNGDLVPNAKEQAYIDGSIAKREASAAEERARQEREQQLEQRSRNFSRALVVVFALATVVSLWFLNDSIAQRRIAERSANEARSLALVNAAQLAIGDDNYDQAIVLSLEATRIPNSPVQAQRVFAQSVYAPGTQRQLLGQAGPAWSIAHHPSRPEAFMGTDNGSILHWNITTGDLLYQLRGHQQAVRSVAVSPDGSLLLSAADDGAIMLWNIAATDVQPQSLRRLLGHSAPVNALAVSSDNQRALSASSDGSLVLWSLPAGEPLLRLQGHEGRVHSVAFTPNGQQAVSGSNNGVMIVWDMNSGAIIRQAQAYPASETLWDIAMMPNGQQVLVASSDRSVALWNVTSMEQVRRLEGHSDQVYSVTVSADGMRAVSASQDTSLIHWDVVSGDVLRRFGGHSGGVQGVQFAPGGDHVVSAAFDGTARLWELRNGVDLGRLAGHRDRIRSVATSPDGRLALSASDDLTLILWDLASQEIQARFEGHTARVRDVVFSPDGLTAVSGGDDNSVILWDVQSGSVLQRLEGHSNGVYALAFHPEGQQVVSGSSDGEAILWDVRSGSEVRRFSADDGWVRGIDISPDGSQLLTAVGAGQAVYLWDIESGEQLQRLSGHGDWLWDVTFSPDGQRALSTASDSIIFLWDLQSGEALLQLEGHTAPVYTAIFSADGRYALSASGDATVRLWELEGGQELRRYENTSAVWGVALAELEGQNIIVSAGEAGLLQLWALSPSLPALTDWAFANRFVRDLTCLERLQYSIEPLCEPGQAAQAQLP